VAAGDMVGENARNDGASNDIAKSKIVGVALSALSSGIAAAASSACGMARRDGGSRKRRQHLFGGAAGVAHGSSAALRRRRGGANGWQAAARISSRIAIRLAHGAAGVAAYAAVRAAMPRMAALRGVIEIAVAPAHHGVSTYRRGSGMTTALRRRK